MARKERSAFHRGFLAGFASPYAVFQPPRRHRPTAADLVAASWRRVGRVMHTAMRFEEQADGENARG